MIQIISHTYKEWWDRIIKWTTHEEVTKPLMRYREIEIVEEILKNLQPKKCLELGAGYSTLSFPEFLGESAKWISIEHERHWFKKIKDMNRRSNVEIFHIPPNRFPWTDEHKDGDYSDLKDYVEFPSKFGEFDFILVDGRARNDCLIKAYELIKSDGVVVLHDANREYYHEPFKLYKHQILLKDYRKDPGGLWIGSKGREIMDVLDVDKHLKYWRETCVFGKVLRI